MTAARFDDQSREFGALATLTGTLTCIVCASYSLTFALDWLSGFRILRPAGLYWLYCLLAVLAIMGYRQGQNLRRLGRRHLAIVIEDPHDLAGTSFVLYLRSFETDTPLSASHWNQRPLSRSISPFVTGRTEEEQFAAALRRVGPLVAVDVDGKHVPPAGAIRMAPLGQRWQEQVQRLMYEARLVVVVLGESDGIMWELTTAMRSLPPEKILLAVPLTPDSYQSFRTRVHRDVRLPDDPRSGSAPASPRGHTRTTLRGLIHFTARESTFVPLTIDEHPVVAHDIAYAAFRRGLRGSLRNLARFEHASRPTRSSTDTI